MALAGAAAGDRPAAHRWLDDACARVPELRREAQHDPLLAAL
jgi:hypothetical protein